MMRSLLIAGAVIALIAADGAAAQVAVHRGAGYPMPGARPAPSMERHGGGDRWGSKVDGRWWGGANAPGGWNAYHRPVRGYALPRYWTAKRFYVSDWSSYGLDQPPVGYTWARYYDDAVLVDSRGSVFDSVDDVDWDGSGSDSSISYAHDVPPPRRDNGVGGAVIGGVAGGVAGNLIAGRGNRLGGTLIGAGVGAAAGYAIDRNGDHDRRGPPPPHGRGYGADYPPPGPGFDGGDYPPPPPRGPDGYRGGHGGTWVSPDGMTTVTTTRGGQGGASYYDSGYYGGGSTTVTVQTAPVVTTTTTYEDVVTYSRPHVRKVSHKRVWHPRPACVCRTPVHSIKGS